MQEHEACFATAAAEIQQATTSQLEGLATLTSQVQQLMAALTKASAATLLPPPAPAATRLPLVLGSGLELWVDDPKRYAGDLEGCNSFITNCSIIYALQPHTFASEGARVAFAWNHLKGRERQWETAKFERQSLACVSCRTFPTELCKVFGEPHL